LRDQVANDRGWDRVATDLITASGVASQSGPANFYKLASDPRDIGEFVGRIFLGRRIACARCHHHPFDRWSQDDYYGFAALFARTRYDQGRIRVLDRGEVLHPRTRRPVDPRPLGSEPVKESEFSDARVALAAWLVSAENPWFAAAMVNWVWKEMMGRGLVEPVDDMRPTNPASIPGILKALTAEFAGGDYRLKDLIRCITNSRAYQLSSRGNAINRTDDRFFSHAHLKPLRAHILADAVVQVTGVADTFDGYAPGTPAVRLVDSQVSSYALDVLGRCPRETGCEASDGRQAGLAQALHMINGTTVNAKLWEGIERRILPGVIPERFVIEELYLSALSRFPSDEELSFWETRSAQTVAQPKFFEDLLWGLLNSREFAYNH